MLPEQYGRILTREDFRLFAELKALVALAESGSMERAARDLYLTPSAFTRRIQRLEMELGVVLLDRHFKPPKITQWGFEVLAKGRSILSSLSDLKSSTAKGSAPTGPFRLGFSHAVAQPEIAPVIVELGNRFPLLRPTILNDVSSQLLARLRLGELEGAVVVLPIGTVPPDDLEGGTLALERMQPVEARSSAPGKSAQSAEFYRRSWILNPAGCLVREEIKRRVERLGAPLAIAAELHSPGLQLSLTAGNVGVGILRTGFVRTHALRSRLRVIDHPEFNLSVRIAFFRGRYLGAREKVAMELQQMLVKHFKAVAS